MIWDKLTSLKLPVFHFSFAELEEQGRSFFVLLVTATIAYASVGVFYDVLSISLLGNGSIMPAFDVVAPTGSITREPVESYAVIPQRNLFGSTEKTVVEKTEAPAQVQVPDLSLLLEVKGTVAGTGKDGFAVIQEKGKNKQLLYKVGNMVAGGKIVNISRNAVTFSIGDQEKVLKMVEAGAAPLLPSRPASPASAMPLPAAGSMVISRSDIDASLKDMGTMLSQAQIRPYYTNGVPDGFIISNIRPGSIYEKIGLLDGDIVQAADDRKLVTADDMTALYNSMKANPAFSLKIKRRGQQESLQYQVR